MSQERFIQSTESILFYYNYQSLKEDVEELPDKKKRTKAAPRDKNLMLLEQIKIKKLQVNIATWKIEKNNIEKKHLGEIYEGMKDKLFDAENEYDSWVGRGIKAKRIKMNLPPENNCILFYSKRQ